MGYSRIIVGAALATTLVVAHPNPARAEMEPVEPSIRHEIELAIRSGLEFLKKAQKEDGSWSQYPAVTALGATAFLRSGMPDMQNDPSVAFAMNYLNQNIQPDGGIYPTNQPQLPSYNTSVCLLAYVAAENSTFAETIRKARDFLIRLQADERVGLTPDSANYGGIGYNADERSDMSNMQWALEALKKSEKYRPGSEATGIVEYSTGAITVTSSKGTANLEEFWDKALVFLQRCQNLKDHNDQEWATNDGGFVYYPGESKAGGTTSYGSMSYAGMRSLIFAGLGKEDERVKSVHAWISKHWEVEKNPEMGDQGLYYYYHSMAKALQVYGDPMMVDSAGHSHDWRQELADALLKRQHSDGSWVNENGRWWENNADLVTAYSVLTLEEILGR